jgi:chromosome segregation ATPase
MGWFNSNSEKEKASDKIPELPSLPELPRLPHENETPRHLPPIPSSNFSKPSFKERTPEKIKFAISGKKEGEERSAEFPEPKSALHPLAEKRSQEIETNEWEVPSQHPRISTERTEPKKIEEHYIASKRIPEEFHEAVRKVKDSEPVFVRIDKFQESLKIFDKIRKELAEVESHLKEVKDLKEEETKELEQWQQGILEIKEQIKQIDRDVFSKVD